MAEIVGMVALSHSPFWDLSLDIHGPGQDFVRGVIAARALVQRQRPDVFVIFGPDHFRNFFYDVMPPFCIGVEQVNGFGDYGSAKGALPVAGELARDIHGGVTAAGFDPAVSLRMGVDHGISQPYGALDPAMTTPIVPIMVNSGGAPRPQMRRCHQFGEAVGAAIRRSPGAGRVMILASGGLSHWVRPVSEDDPAIDAEMRAYVIGGRDRVVAYSAARDASVRERAASGVNGKTNPRWDRWFLSALETGDLDGVLALDPHTMEQEAGNGSHEVRAWLAAVGAWGGPVETLAYEPVARWVTGMGCVAGTASAAAG